MALPRPDTAVLQDVLDRFHASNFNYTEVARQTKYSRTSIQNYVRYAKESGLTPAVNPSNENALQVVIENLRTELAGTREKLAKADERLAKATRPRFTIRQEGARSEKIRIVCIGDAHDSPAIPDKSRFELIGSYIDKVKPDVVVQIGDFLTLDSLNSHVPNENYDGKSKPSFREDIASGVLALDALNSKLNYQPEKHVTLGNHERRLYLFEQRAPEAYGMMQEDLHTLLSGRNWTYSPYGLYQMYGGVGFIHIPLNRLGKTFGGKNAETTIANEAVFSIVKGHSHTERAYRAPKLHNHNHEIIVMDAGCALPDQFIEKYAEHAETGWAWGIYDLTIQHGHIQGRNWIPMATLKEMFG